MARPMYSEEERAQMLKTDVMLQACDGWARTVCEALIVQYAARDQHYDEELDRMLSNGIEHMVGTYICLKESAETQCRSE